MKKEFDPRMHSAEHILNQTMIRMFNCGRCFSSHIEKKKSKCDYYFDHSLTKDEINEIEKRINAIIQDNIAVKEEYITKEEAERNYNLDRVPRNVDEKIRIVKIGDYDACPCIGPHVNSTREIGEFIIVSTNFDNGVLRIRYKLAKRGKQ